MWSLERKFVITEKQYSYHSCFSRQLTMYCLHKIWSLFFRWRQPASFLRQVLAKWQIHSCRDTRQVSYRVFSCVCCPDVISGLLLNGYLRLLQVSSYCQKITPHLFAVFNILNSCFPFATLACCPNASYQSLGVWWWSEQCTCSAPNPVQMLMRTIGQ